MTLTEPERNLKVSPDPTYLLAAWQEWDRDCHAMRSRFGAGDARAACRMEDACISYARALGLTTTEFRDRLMAAKRGGLGNVHALEQVTREAG